MAREEVSSKMYLKRDLQEIKCAMIAHFISWPHKNASEKRFEEGRKICPAKGIDMIRKYGTVEV